MYQNYMGGLSQFVLVLGQFVTLLFWTICQKSYLSQFNFGQFVIILFWPICKSHICHNFIWTICHTYVILSDPVLSQ